jgi:hypothetical protein
MRIQVEVGAIEADDPSEGLDQAARNEDRLGSVRPAGVRPTAASTMRSAAAPRRTFRDSVLGRQ